MHLPPTDERVDEGRFGIFGLWALPTGKLKMLQHELGSPTSSPAPRLAS